jgi:hypothetical protein
MSGSREQVARPGSCARGPRRPTTVQRPAVYEARRRAYNLPTAASRLAREHGISQSLGHPDGEQRGHEPHEHAPDIRVGLYARPERSFSFGNSQASHAASERPRPLCETGLVVARRFAHS